MALMTSIGIAFILTFLQANTSQVKASDAFGVALVDGTPTPGKLVYIYMPEKSENLKPFSWRIADGQFDRQHVAIEMGQPLIISWAKKQAVSLSYASGELTPSGRLVPNSGANPFRTLFEKPLKLVRFECSVNPKVIGYVTVVPSRFYGWTNDQGSSVSREA